MVRVQVVERVAMSLDLPIATANPPIVIRSRGADATGRFADFRLLIMNEWFCKPIRRDEMAWPHWVSASERGTYEASCREW